MAKKPLFTVIIPAKDRAQYLQHTLRTCSLQEYPNLEVIVADVGSTDNTKEIVEAARTRDGALYSISTSVVRQLSKAKLAYRWPKPVLT